MTDAVDVGQHLWPITEAHGAKGGNPLCDAIEFIVEMNLHFSGRDASKAPIYIHCMYMVHLLSDNSIVENRLKDRKSNVNGRKCLKLVENKCPIVRWD